MNSQGSDDLTRENLALETAKVLISEVISTNAEKINALEQEIARVDLSINAALKESQKKLEKIRLDKANEGPTPEQVVQIRKILRKTRNSKKYWNYPKMSSPTPFNRNTRMNKPINVDNNNRTKFTERQQARFFIAWYKHMIDNDRNNLALYLSDDAMLEWFGRTVKNRRKVSTFLKFDMQCSRHDFTTVESIERVEMRSDRLQRKDDTVLASYLNSPEIVRSERPGKRKLFQSCGSPEWAEGCKPHDDSDNKRSKKDNTHNEVATETQCNGRKRLFSDDDSEINSRGDGVPERRPKRQCTQDSTVTPPNKEVGQGDCLPSTSGTDSDRSHDTLNAQLPKLAVECNGYIEFTRSRNSRSSDTMKWERKCKVQISYSEDPLNVGEYIIWMLRYTDETKCRRNLLAAFEEVAKEESKNT